MFSVKNDAERYRNQPLRPLPARAMKTKKIITVITLFVYMFCSLPAVAYAGEPEQKIMTIRKGQPAPYSGTLFNTAAAARLQVDLQFTEASCNIETDRQLGLLRSKLQLDIDLLCATPL